MRRTGGKEAVAWAQAGTILRCIQTHIRRPWLFSTSRYIACTSLLGSAGQTFVTHVLATPLYGCTLGVLHV